METYQTTKNEQKSRVAIQNASKIEIRVRRLDDRNFVIEKWDAPHISETGPTKGQMIQGRWLAVGHYGRLEHVAKYLLDKSISGTFENTEEVLVAIRGAEARILESLKKLYHT